MMRASGHRPTLTLAIVAAALWLLMLLSLWATRMSLDIASVSSIASLATLQTGLAVYCRARGLSRLQPLVEINLLFTLVTLALLPISYASLRFAMPLADDWLVRADAAFLFDWAWLVGFVDARPRLAELLHLSYVSFHAQLLLLPLYFALFRRGARGHAIVLAYALIVLAASFVSIWFPTQGAYVAHGAADMHLSSIDTTWAFSYLDEFHLLRSSPDFLISLDRIEGALTFPSVHAAVALLCTWAAWGSRYLLLPLAILNGLMSIAAITHASHFLVDIFAGYALAAVVIWIVARLLPVGTSADSRAAEAELFDAAARQLRGRLRPVALPGRGHD